MKIKIYFDYFDVFEICFLILIPMKQKELEIKIKIFGKNLLRKKREKRIEQKERKV